MQCWKKAGEDEQLPAWAGREVTLRRTIESIVDDERQNTRREQHCECVMWRSSASDALDDTANLDLIHAQSGEDIFPRLLFSSTARLPFSFGKRNPLVQGGCTN